VKPVERTPGEGKGQGDLVGRLATELVEHGQRRALEAQAQAELVQRLQAEVRDLTRAERRARKRERRLEARLEAVYGSVTWRVGRAALWLPKRIAGRRRRA
jgi:hypothetical protein